MIRRRVLLWKRVCPEKRQMCAIQDNKVASCEHTAKCAASKLEFQEAQCQWPSPLDDITARMLR